MVSGLGSGFRRAALALLIVTFAGAAAPASAGSSYPSGWNQSSTPPAELYVFTPGSNHRHLAPGAAMPESAAPDVAHSIVYQFVPGGSRMHRINQ